MIKMPAYISSFITILFKSIAYTYNNKRVTIIRLFSFFGFFLFTSFILIRVLNQEEERIRNDAITNLQLVLNSSHFDIKNIWANGYFNGATNYVSDSVFLQNTKELLKLTNDHQALLNSAALARVRKSFAERLRQHDNLGMFIISPSFTSLASMRDENVGTVNFIANEYSHILERVFEGHNRFIPPIASDVPLPDKKGKLVDGYPTMFVLVPIKDTDGSIIAVLSIRLNPFDDFALMMQNSKMGNSGETYLVNKEGKMLCESRFIDDLYKAGVLEKEQVSMLNVEVRDPGVNLFEDQKPGKVREEQPFTYATQQVIKDTSGFSKIAYRDYRGVSVLGAWRWDEELNLGFISEIDEDEVLESYRNSQSLIIGLLLATIFLMIVISYINWWAQSKNLKLIEKNERYFRTILDNTVSGIVIIDTKGIVEAFNKEAESMFGYSAKELIGKNVSILANEFDRLQHDKYIQNYVETREPKIIGSPIEVEGIRKDGSLFPIRLSISEIDVNKRQVFMGMLEDLTQEKESAKKLHEIEKMFEFSFSQVPISMANMDKQGSFLKVNQAMCSLLGYTEGELLTISRKEITHPDDLKESAEALQKLIRNETSVLVMEKRYVRKGGKIIWGRVTISHLLNKAGEVENFIIVLEDITSRKLAEQGLLKRSDELEQINTELEKSKRVALSIMQDANMQRERVKKTLKDLELSNASLKKLSLAVGQSVAAIVITNKAGIIEYVNPAFTKVSGYTFEEAVNNPPGLLKSGKHSKAFYKNLWETILAGKTWKGDIVNKKKTGEEFWESVSISAMVDEAGEITHFVAVKEDITERKFLEGELRKLSEAVEQSPSSIVITDTRGYLEYVNPRFMELTGYPAEEAIGKNISILNSGFHSQAFFKDLWDTITAGEIWHGELCNKRKGGEIYWDSASISPIKDEDGKIVNYVGIHDDITARKIMEDELKKSKETAEGLYHVSKELSSTLSLTEVLDRVLKELKNVVSFDSATIQVANDGHLEVVSSIGYPRNSDMLNSKFSIEGDLFSRLSEDNTKPVIIDDVRAYPEFKDFSKDNSIRSCLAIPLIIDESFIGIITLDKMSVGYYNTEHAQRIMAFASNTSIAVRNARLFADSERAKLEIKAAEQDLRKAYEKEKNLGELKSRFVSIASHQFRTPLTVIQSNVELLQMQSELMGEKLKPKFERASGRIISEVKRMTELMNDVLILGKINAEKVQIQIALIDVKSVCQELVDEYNGIQTDNREVDYIIEGKPVELMLDKKLFNYSISNLLSNALKYSEGCDNPKLILNFSKKLLRVSVKDHGIGIPESEMENLFQPFFRAINTTETPGTGLGLAICKEYVELNGGSIDVESIQNEGTTFNVEFQIKK